MTTTPHQDPAAARYVAPAGLRGPHEGAPWVPEYARAQPFLTFPAARRPQPSAVLATRIVGLCLTAAAALWPAFFALLAIAFGLGLENLGAMVFGVVAAAVAVGWPLGFWFATTGARSVWPVLVALVPTALVLALTLYIWL